MSGPGPQTAGEQVIAAILQEVLGVQRVAIDDNFFELGGTSALLVQAHGRLERAFGREIPLADLFTHPTVADLALALAGSAGPGDVPLGESAERASDARTEKLLAGRGRLLRRRGQQQGR